MKRGKTNKDKQHFNYGLLPKNYEGPPPIFRGGRKNKKSNKKKSLKKNGKIRKNTYKKNTKKISTY
jgi:hypothetical protein